MKLLSHDPARAEDAAIAGIRRLHRGRAADMLVKMGTTVATNALLERRGARTLLLVTRGFADALRIGHQARPQIFARHILLPDQLAGRVAEVDERVAVDGALLVPLDEAGAQAVLAAGFAEGYRSVAICLMHGWAFPAHEQRLAALARAAGFTQVSASHDVSPLVKFVPRGDTAVADAYLSPVLGDYVQAVARALPAGTRLMFMQSNGGLAGAAAFRGKDAILSGPAGGIIGMARTAETLGFDALIGFDMGGTSTDVSHYAGVPERRFETTVAGVRLRAPMLDIHTVAAGGGSICFFADGRLQVGPRSAGAVPGPACYRHGGPLTVTDCNVALGRVVPAHFPHLFGPGGDAPIDRAASMAALAQLADRVAAATGIRPDEMALAEGLVAIANAHMAAAIRHISIARGHDPATHALVAFGGAGGQHGCALADALGIDVMLVHPMAGLLSALGIGLADLVAARELTLGLPFDAGLAARAAVEAGALEQAARAALLAQGLPMGEPVVRMTAHVRYAGSDTALPVTFADVAAMRRDFEAAHRARFGFQPVGAGLVLDMLSAEAVAQPLGAGGGPISSAPAGGDGQPQRVATARFDGADVATPLFLRANLPACATVDGPAIISDPSATTVVAPGWRAVVAADGTLIVRRVQPRLQAPAAGTYVDPIRLELFNALFMGVATEMGVALQTSALSVNMKERLDFSCALFDGAGNLVANAPHIPVHLGSMGASIRAVLAARSQDGRGIWPGDVFVLNAPWNGGTHLPDITVIKPCFPGSGGAAANFGTGGAPDFFVAARGHHADVGGITPGSMPPDSLCIDEEGVLLDAVLLVDRGRLLEADIAARLAAGPWPARNIAQNLGDLKAQIAACQRGADALAAAAGRYGTDVLLAYMRHVQDNAAETVARLIPALRDGEFSVPMDDGAVIRVAVRVDAAARRLTVDFTGTSAMRPNNFNAPASVARAALLYVLRCLVDAPIPLNDGALAPVTLIVPEGSMLCAAPPAAVVAGNVETSQAVTDALFGALGAMAAAQGTMNNFTFGNAQHQYYETIAGGSGAGPDHPGTSAVQTHMTNSRLTDPEILESRFPVRVESFRIRAGSGGAGRFAGGDGTVRRIRFLEPMTAAILSNRRITVPFGLAGGGDGQPGANRIIRADGRVEPLPATARAQMAAGDCFEIETPGGGGYGAP